MVEIDRFKNKEIIKGFKVLIEKYKMRTYI